MMDDDKNINFEGDLHICGSCQTQEMTIPKFLEHKRICLKSKKNKNQSNFADHDHQDKEKSFQSQIQNIPSNIVEECASLMKESVGELNFTTLQQAVIIRENQNHHNSVTPLKDYINSLSSSPFAFQETVNIENDNSDHIDDPIPDKDISESLYNGNAPQTENILIPEVPHIKSPDNSSLNEQQKYKIYVDSESGSKRFKCCYDNCSYSSIYLKDWARHYLTHTGEKPYFCKLCDKRFSRMDKLRTHELTHTGKKPHKCTECTYAATDRSSLLKHLRIHKNERPFKCQICTYASRNSSQLIVHLRTHTGDAPFHCTLCKMKFKINADLKRHMFLHTGEKPYSCPKCSFHCNNKGNLNIHIRSIHNEESVLHCDKCTFSTSSKAKFREHGWCHTNHPIKCSQCNFSTTTQSALKVHQRVHSSEKPFRCDHCSYTSRQACNIRTHSKKHHPKTLMQRLNGVSEVPLSHKRNRKHFENEQNRPFCSKSFKCNLCQAAFVRKDSLDSHLRHHQSQMTQAINKSNVTANVKRSAMDNGLNNHEEGIATLSHCTFSVENAKVDLPNDVIGPYQSCQNAPTLLSNDYQDINVNLVTNGVLSQQDPSQNIIIVMNDNTVSNLLYS